MEAELKQQFEEIGSETADDIISKSIELCLSYNIEDAAEFVEQWMAFSVSHLHGAEPTLPHLAEFERKVFQVKRDKEMALAHKKKTTAHVHYAATAAASVNINPLAIYGVQNDMDLDDDALVDTVGGAGRSAGMDEDDMLNSYNVMHTPKAKSALARTPARHNRHNDALFSPASYSPILGTPRAHATAGSGNIVYTFGNSALINTAKWSVAQQQQQQEQPKIHVKQLLLHNGESLNAVNGRYMFDGLREKADMAAERLLHIGKCLCRQVFGADAEDYELCQVDVHSQETVKTLGTIYCEHEGPLDAYSTLLFGSDESRCRSVRLNFSKLKSVAVFPGQIVIVSGHNPKGDEFMVEEILAEHQLQPPKPPSIPEQLSFVVAAGPYTHDDDLIYDPLHNLITYLKGHKPNVLILTGPFLDADHKLLNENITLAETFESFFERMIAGIVEAIGTATTILIVTSHKDAYGNPVYPTAPITLKKTYANVHMLPDPSMIDLNGFVIGLTSTDIFDHLNENELSINVGDKIKRVVNYLFHQGSFYPLNPPAEDKICFDSELAYKYANITQIPNVLILPSDQKCFIRAVNGCLAINPGRVADNNGGTFARFIVTPPAPKDESNILNYLACQVRKV